MFGISFLNPWLLLGAVGAAIPIALHLLGKRRLTPYSFSSLELLRKTSEEQRRRSRVTEFLLLLIRTLTLLLLSLALARPFSGMIAQPNLSGDRFVFVIDNTPSSLRTAAAGPVLEQIRGRLPVLLADVPAGSLVTVAQMAGADPFLVYDKPREALDIPALVNRIAPQSGTQADVVSRELADLYDAESATLPRFVYLGDGQEDSLAVLERDHGALNAAWQFILVAGEEQPEVSVGRATLSTDRPVVDAPVTVSLEVAVSRALERDVRCQLFAGTDLVTSALVPASPGSHVVTMVWRPRQRGTVPLSCRCGADGFPLDNVAFFGVDVGSQYRTLLVAPDETGPGERFLDALLEPGLILENAPASPFDVTFVPQSSLTEGLLRDAPLIVAEDLAPPYEAFRDLIGDAVARGAVLALFPGEAFDAMAFNRTFFEQDPTPIAPFPLQEVQDFGLDDLTPIRVSPDLDFAGRRQSRLIDFDLRRWWVPGVTTSGDFSTVLTSAQGRPLFAVKGVGAGYVVQSTFGVGPEESGFLGWPGALPLLHNLFLRLLGSDVVPASLSAGAIPETLATAGISDATLSLDRLPPEIFDIVDAETLKALDMGFWTATRPDQGPVVFGANLPPTERTSPILSEGQVKERFPGALFSTGRASGNLVRQVTARVSTSEYLLWLVLALLVVETFLANPIGGFWREVRSETAQQAS